MFRADVEHHQHFSMFQHLLYEGRRTRLLFSSRRLRTSCTSQAGRTGQGPFIGGLAHSTKGRRTANFGLFCTATARLSHLRSSSTRRWRSATTRRTARPSSAPHTHIRGWRAWRGAGGS
jgi:hypothetical protein